MRNAVIPTVFIEGALAADTHPRHQAAGRIIDAGVDYLAVARRGNGSDTFRGLQDDHLAAGLCQPPRDRKTDHPRHHDHALNFVHTQLRSGARLEALARVRDQSYSHTITLFGMMFSKNRVDPCPSIFASRAPVSEA